MLKKINLLQIIIFLAPLLTGLLNNYSVCIVSILCIIGILSEIIKKQKIILPRGKNLFFIMIYVLSYLVIELYAIDKGMNIFGFLRAISLLLFIILISQYNKKERESILNIIPYSGIVSLAVSIMLILFNNLDIVIDGRLNGTLFYANSYALFLLVGIYILLTKEKIKTIDYIMVFILGIGILFTNSRAVIVLMLFTILVLSVIKLKKDPKKLLILFFVILSLVLIYFNTNLSERMNSNIFKSSEFQMRLVYYKDAIEIIKDNPFGLGYNGYYYKQVETQTAPYYTKSAHDFVLQLFLDVGIIPALGIIYILVLGIISKKQTNRNRFLIVLILLHSLIDINLEYGYFWLLIFAQIDFEIFELRIKNKKIYYVLASLLSFIYLIFLISSFAFESKNYELAYKIVPFYTDALIQDLYSTKDGTKQIELSNRIYDLNKNLTATYQVLSVNEQKNNNYEKALEYEKCRLNLNRLSVESYEKYFKFLESAFKYYNSKEDYESLCEIMNEILKIKDMVAEINKTANPSYVPTLQLSDEIEKVCEAIYELKNGGDR